MSRTRATRREALAAAGVGLGSAALAGTASAKIDRDLQKKLEKAAVSSATFGELTKTVAFDQGLPGIAARMLDALSRPGLMDRLSEADPSEVRFLRRRDEETR